MQKTMNQPGAAVSSPVQDYLQYLHDTFAGITEGQVATYIPELAKANPSWFGIALVTTGGTVYEVGDSRQEFTIQSISKPFVYGLALQDQGRAKVLERVGVEPTGDAFNSISLDPVTGRPRNPMINAGAIATAGLVEGKSQRGKLRRVMDMLSTYAGRELRVDTPVYASENETGHRNRAIGHMLRNFDKLEGDPIPTVELYFQQCSVSVNCRDLAVMAATLANRGINPLTQKQAIQGTYVESVLSVMGSCGMYDYAGEWIYTIGMPAKSGVAGGLIAVLPGQLGIGVFSPPLDSRGNSVRGIRVCNELSRHLDLHLFNRQPVGKSAIRLRSSGAEFASHRVRTARESTILQRQGSSIAIYQLQGHLTFASAEVVLDDITKRLGEMRYINLDLKRVLSINESACRLFYELMAKLRAVDKPLLFVPGRQTLLLRRYMKARLGDEFESSYQVFPELDPALEWCENHLIAAELAGTPPDISVLPGDYELFAHMTPLEIGHVAKLFKRKRFKAGETIIQKGDPADELFFLAKGRTSVLVPTDNGGSRRLATFSAGMTFGEMAVLDGAPRSAMIVADTEVECDVLQTLQFEALSLEHPGIKIKLLQNLGLSLCAKLRKANRELSVLE